MTFLKTLPLNLTKEIPRKGQLQKVTMAPSGIRPSPIGIAVVVIVILGSVYYFATLDNEYRYMPEAVDLQQLLVAGIAIAERGGTQVKEVHESKKLDEQSKGETKEGVNDPLTQGDIRSHIAMVGSFQKAFPYVKVVSEEKEAVVVTDDIKLPPTYNEEVDKLVAHPQEIVDSREVTIWVDPLDATKEYTEDLLQYVTTMVCVAVQGKPVIGIIHKPFEGKTFWSWVGHGTNIRDDSSKDGTHSIIVSRSHSGEVKETAKKAFGDDAKIIPAGGAGYKSLALFNGEASVYVHTTIIKKWDICAGSAILAHAKGKMTTLKGENIDFSNDREPKNEGGLVASLHDHDTYLSKLGAVL